MIASETKARRPAGVDRALKLWVVLAKAYLAVAERSDEEVRAHGLTATEFGILEALYHRGPLLLGDLQRKILLSSGGVTYTVDRLAEKGLVQRQDCATDRRARYAVLTAEGKKLIARIFPGHADRIVEAVSALGAREQEEAIALLRKLGLGAERASG